VESCELKSESCARFFEHVMRRDGMEPQVYGNRVQKQSSVIQQVDEHRVVHHDKI
jgi:hypothetical protein